jgi:hypothetical protein
MGGLDEAPMEVDGPKEAEEQKETDDMLDDLISLAGDSVFPRLSNSPVPDVIRLEDDSEVPTASTYKSPVVSTRKNQGGGYQSGGASSSSNNLLRPKAAPEPPPKAKRSHSVAYGSLPPPVYSGSKLRKTRDRM